ncbi:hypothetical protein V6N13_122696 [Hibiscus sabdariffa]|uniref:Uncharacterized protein n=1 Tax=Hibiscus sabdariffa TaxID=183260 RepID=A0ABR2P3Z8_9ROSI
MDWASVQKSWEKWASSNIGSSGQRQTLKAALLINYDPLRPSRLLSTMCLNASKSTGEGAIVMQTSVFLLVALYDGSIGLASRAVASVDQLAWTLNRRNL